MQANETTASEDVMNIFKFRAFFKALATRKFRRDLDHIVTKVTGLEEFGFPHGDSKYVLLKERMDEIIEEYMASYAVTLDYIVADNPAIERVFQAVLEDEPVDTVQDKVQAGVQKAIGAMIGFGIALLILGPIVLAGEHHFYTWLMRVF